MAILIAGMSANMSSGSSDAIAAVSIMLRDLYTLVTGHMPAPESDSPVADLPGSGDCAGAAVCPDLQRHHQLHHQNDLNDYVRDVYLHHAWPFLDTL